MKRTHFARLHYWNDSPCMYDACYPLDAQHTTALAVHYFTNGDIERISYFQGNLRHREGGPALIQYWGAGKGVQHIDYYLHGQLHREDGPACTGYDEEGSVRYESYYQHGRRIREDGPVLSIRWVRLSDGAVYEDDYCLNGVWQ